MDKWLSVVSLVWCIFSLIHSSSSMRTRKVIDRVSYTGSWAVKIDGDEETANDIAKTYGFVNKGKVGNLDGYYHFVDTEPPSRYRRSFDIKHISLMNEVKVISADQQIVKKRTKRQIVLPQDSWWSKQWYLHRKGRDMNTQPVWNLGVTGKGVVVTILDDGIEYNHPDLKRNYDPNASYDYNSHDSDPTPRYDFSNENKHGTRCAGEVAAGLNRICSVGVAYNAKIGGIRMLDGDVTDIVEANSLSFNSQHIDIYSSSWGPTDDGKTVDGPGNLAKLAFMNGINKGRNGKGSIFVWASGNGGLSGDSCNCDGYAVSPYTISIGSITEHNDFPWYAEECSSNLASTYSSGSGGEKKVVSTDLHNKCTDHHTGTSAAAPMAAGLIALVLEVVYSPAVHSCKSWRSLNVTCGFVFSNTGPDLTWRDIQYIIVYSSNPLVPHDNNWITNGIGLKVSSKFGFGLMNAAAMVNRARHWIRVPGRNNCTLVVDTKKYQKHPKSSLDLQINITKSNCPVVQYLEHVQAITSLSVIQGSRGGIKISLRSPSNTLSTLLQHRQKDRQRQGFDEWPFMTVMSWGENPLGQWTFSVSTTDNTKFNLTALTFVLYGLPNMPQSVVNIPEVCSPVCKYGCSRNGTKYCDECQSKQVLFSLQCVETCPIKTYTRGSYCFNCSDHCNMCFNSKNCTQCDSGYFLSRAGFCSLSCDESSVLINGSCLPCHVSCKSCVGLSSKDCTECHGANYALSDGVCIFHTNCSSGQYFEHRILGCKKCYKTCLECTGRGDSDCTSCHPSSLLLEGKCIAKSLVCLNGEFFSNDTQSCATCSPNCVKCHNGITCTQCNTGYFLHSVQLEHSYILRSFCVKSCPTGYYANNKIGCAKCHSFCETCHDSPNICTSCINSHMLTNDSHCASICKINMFYDYSSEQCRNCPMNCTSCINDTYCNSCYEGFSLNREGQCLLPCVNHTVQNPLSGRCETTNCYYSCSTCFGPGSHECLSCSKTTVLFRNNCLQFCPDSWYKHKNSCFECHNTCKTCSGPTEGECLSCHSGKYLDHYHCLDHCRPSLYAGAYNNCLPCPFDCISCFNSTKCIKCRPSYVMGPSDVCVRYCPHNYFNVNSICIPNKTISASNTAVPPLSLPSKSWAFFMSFLTFTLVFGIVLILGIFLWKRHGLFRILKGSQVHYVALNSHQEFELNDQGAEGSESETEVFSQTRKQHL